MESLLKELSETFNDHEIAPGVLVSWLPIEKRYYASIHIFENNARSILVKSFGSTAELAIRNLRLEYEQLVAKRS